MLKKILPLAILPFLSLVQPAAAQQPYWWQGNQDSPYHQVQQDYGQDDAEAIYGPDPYASRAQDFDEQQYRMYRREMARRYHREQRYQQYDQQQEYGYNQPYAAPVYPVQPQGKVIVQANKPVVKKKAPAKPTTTTASTSSSTSASTTTTVASTAPATTSTTAPAATTASTTQAAPKKGGAVTCDKGASIVSSFGFEKVASKSCAATSLVYSAERGGKPFEIEVNPKSGELTAVKKL
ncbi:hypothetical protein [Aestuariivirga litoralis]|uniref:hypothetical protein n=1 Tax=Aestuariivirga litoralis TaxID=2650924 RepID=UPI0018C72F98|nr:hypothetical protein [Aestuariivirga litoralis]MBG1233613.1 hypothetical protein [Aestuariivirga litoralis]